MRKKTGNKDKSILDAAIKLFAKNGYYGTTIQDIATEADIGVGSVYSYFKSKEEILDTIFTNLWIDLIDDLELIAKISDSFDHKIETHTTKLFELFFKNRNLSLVYINEFNILQHKNYKYMQYYNRYYDILSELFSLGKESGVFKTNLDFEILKYFIIGGIRNIIIQFYENSGKYNDEAIKVNILSLLKYGFINEKQILK